METDNGSTESLSDPWSIYPIFNLEAEWKNVEPEYFDLDVRLIRPDDTALGKMGHLLEVANIWQGAFDPESGIVRWVLALRVPEAVDHVPPVTIGMSFMDRVEEAIVRSFLTCLKIVRSTEATCPISCYAELHGRSLGAMREAPYDVEADSAPPRTDWPISFQEGDLCVIREVWAGIVKLRQLRRWMTAPFQEVFFAQLDQAASRRIKSDWRRRLEGKGMEKGQLETVLEALVQDRDFWEWNYREALRAEFREQEDLNFNCATRLGRAVGIFEQGVHLPQLHAFLSVCLVLETLLTIDSQEVTHKLATRLAKIVGDEGGPEYRRDLYYRAKKVYRERSNVIHGTISVEKADEAVRKDAFELTRLLLQKILRSDRYLRLFTTEGGHDLNEFFVGLDLA